MTVSNDGRSVARRALRGILAWTAALALVIGVAACDDGSGGDITETDRPDIATDKTQLSFSVVTLGGSADDVITISNNGLANLKIDDIRITGSGADFFVVNVEPNVPYDGREIVLAPIQEDPDAEQELQVVYTPTEVGQHNATLEIHSNDPDVEESPLEIPLNALEVGPRIQVTPNPIVFGQVEAMDSLDLDVSITNVGAADLKIENLSITGSPDFQADAGTRDSLSFDYDTPIEPDETRTFKLWYRPPTQSPDTGVLNIEWLFDKNDPASDRLTTVDIDGNGNEPCIRVTPAESVDFGQAIIGRTSEQPVLIENCGSDNLTLRDISLTSETVDQIALSQVPTAIANGEEDVLARGSSRQFFVTCTPEAEESYTGGLIIESNDPARETLELPVFCTGSFNNCPEAVAGGRIRDTGDPFTDQFAAEPLDFIELTARDSQDPDGDDIVEYRWSVVEAPTGFSLGFVPNARSEDTEIQLALVGDYVFELVVVDENGRESCNPGRVSVRAQTDRALIVELTWRTPDDPDETDTGFGAGTDMDLHMLNGEDVAFWNDSMAGVNREGTDCYFGNASPDWGVKNFDDDNARLDRDDIDGGGPEQINIKTPAFTDGSQADGYSLPYLVGVYFYDRPEDIQPPVFATVRVFLEGSQTPDITWPPDVVMGEQAREFIVSDPTLQRSGDFWIPGSIDWDANGGTLNTIDTFHMGFPNGRQP